MSDEKLTNVETIKVTQGRGYWALSRYPWGGEFHRFIADAELPIQRIVDTYSNGHPRRVILLLNGQPVGIQL